MDEMTKEVRSKEDEGVLRHSACHIMAQSVKRLYPGAKPTVGPVIRERFYYDFDIQEEVFRAEDLRRIEEGMDRVIEEGWDIKRSEMGIEEAINFFEGKAANEYKVEILMDLKKNGESRVSFYEQGDFIDLCRGPHIENTGQLKWYKLLNVSGVYWTRNGQKKKLQRIYGTAFDKEEDLRGYLKRLEELKARDHRRIGKELGLFSFEKEGVGFPFWHGKGFRIYNILKDFIREENEKRGYEEVKTPMILNEELWKKSGHYENFKENMYFTDIDGKEYAIKPMSCPGHCLIYGNGKHSYRELPIRMSEFGEVHRHELSGVLHGLFRVRKFVQDDGHIFCTAGQLKGEVKETLEYMKFVYEKMGFEKSKVYIGTRPKEKYIGSLEEWEESTRVLEESLKESGFRGYEEKEGEGAFYGPKIEFNIEDCLERQWQCGTIQIDFSMVKRLGLSYEDRDGKKKTPVMIHRAILGSLERFIGIIIEHYKGNLPLWLSATQVKILTISEHEIGYGERIEECLKGEGIRVELDGSREKLGYKIRRSQLEKVNFMIIIGKKEREGGRLSVRSRGGEDLGEMGLEELKNFLRLEIYETFK